jgi:hypothetical protein
MTLPSLGLRKLTGMRMLWKANSAAQNKSCGFQDKDEELILNCKI